jgi:hypothetical protein
MPRDIGLRFPRSEDGTRAEVAPENQSPRGCASRSDLVANLRARARGTLAGDV